MHDIYHAQYEISSDIAHVAHCRVSTVNTRTKTHCKDSITLTAQHINSTAHWQHLIICPSSAAAPLIATPFVHNANARTRQGETHTQDTPLQLNPDVRVHIQGYTGATKAPCTPPTENTDRRHGMLSAACPRTRAHHSAAHPCHSTRQVSSHADGAQGSTTARTVESTSTAARCPWARQRCNTGQTAGMDLTLSHERGGAVVQRVHLLRSLAVGVGAHVQLLGPLPEEHLEQGAAASLPRERWKSRVMQEPGRGTTPQDRTRRQATHRDIARPPAARPVLRRAHVRRRGHPPARRPHVITAGARAWVGHENHRTAGARRCRQHAEPASAACFAPHPVPSPCLAPPQAPPPPSPLRHTCFCFAFSPRGRMNAIIPPKSEIYACIYFRRQSSFSFNAEPGKSGPVISTSPKKNRSPSKGWGLR